MVPLHDLEEKFSQVNLTEQEKQLQFHRPTEMEWCPIDLLVVNLSAHREKINFESHDFLLSSNSFLMIFTKLLLENYAKPLP
jgi:hypothetical protein